MRDNIKIDFANTLRGFAALAVLMSHYYYVFWHDRQSVGAFINAPILPVDSYITPHWILWLNVIPILDWGRYGVALFFIISGFVIPFSLQKINWLGFSVSRLLRIFPTYFVGLSITLLAILLSTKYFSNPWPYTVKEILIQYVPGIRDILWSRNIDGIVWTLEIEMKFYLLCAILILWFRRYSLGVFLAPVVLVGIAICLNHGIPKWVNSNLRVYEWAMVYATVAQYILFMFIGVMFHYMYCKKIDLRKGYIYILALFILFCIDWRIGPYSETFSFVWNYAFALLTFAFAYTFPDVFRANKVTNFLADISYPLYVIHGVAGYVVLRIMLDRGVRVWLALCIVTSMAFLLAWLIHLSIEQPSRVLGKKIGGKLTSSTFVNKPLKESVA